ncbi:hypothetical protein FF38_05590 [Lucilia cuprina]|uniref:Uncharacterized protein n=1 Tax=Lucilia cuprina TaxID=7375 RepID=A0A0L0BV04_LUCCU|nr:hypothetical protein FF38_05590 [Lucilia cuprina]
MNIDICEALSAAHKHFLLKMISLEILRTSNLPLECPLKRNVYYFIRNFTINDYYIPPYVPELEFSSYSDFYVNKRKYLTFNSFGKIVDSSRRNRNSLTIVEI